MAEVFEILGCCSNVASALKNPLIIYSCISYFRHAYTSEIKSGKCATQNLKNLRSSVDNMLTYYGHIKEPKKKDDFALIVSLVVILPT